MNFIQRTEEVCQINDFSQFSLTISQQMIDESAEINFIPREKLGDQIFGDIRFTEYKGVKLDFLNELVKTGEAKMIDSYIAPGNFIRFIFVV